MCTRQSQRVYHPTHYLIVLEIFNKSIKNIEKNKRLKTKNSAIEGLHRKKSNINTFEFNATYFFFDIFKTFIKDFKYN